MKTDEADQLGREIADRMAAHWGGQNVYFPMGCRTSCRSATAGFTTSFAATITASSRESTACRFSGSTRSSRRSDARRRPRGRSGCFPIDEAWRCGEPGAGKSGGGWEIGGFGFGFGAAVAAGGTELREAELRGVAGAVVGVIMSRGCGGLLRGGGSQPALQSRRSRPPRHRPRSRSRRTHSAQRHMHTPFLIQKRVAPVSLNRILTLNKKIWQHNDSPSMPHY